MIANLNEDERRMMRRVIAVMSRLRKQDATMSVQRILMLVWVAANEGRPQRDLLAAFKDLTSASISRNVAALSDVPSLGEPGLGLISWRQDPLDRRSNLLHLTPKGRQLCAAVAEDLR